MSMTSASSSIEIEGYILCKMKGRAACRSSRRAISYLVVLAHQSKLKREHETQLTKTIKVLGNS